VASLQEELKKATLLRTNLEEQIRHLDVQVQNRDREIKRMQARLEVGEGNAEKISTEYALETNSKKIEKLNSNIDYLTKENMNLEDTVKNMKKELSRTEHLRTENSNLQLTIQELTRKNEDLRGTLKNTEKILEKSRESKNLAETEIADRKDKKISLLEQEVMDLEGRVSELRAENTKLRSESNFASTLPLIYSFLPIYHSTKYLSI